ncbi:MAG TPA: hypothetical protein ENK57_10515 [Polyangiaceae bacterium]|nr:hypothetical protein [Polyangiaceae bacterium]
MSQAFPFGYPVPTATYLVLYVVTLAVHVLFMNYVLAGSCTLGITALVGRAEERRRGTVRQALVDWLPFAVGLAITAGVAPLLFLQILYEKSFYTANLLLFHRWMLIVPALIAGFYLLYLLKSDWAKARPRVWRVAALGAFLCFFFVAWSWTENHLLSRDADAWVPTYASGKLVYHSEELVPRLCMWIFGSASTMAVALGWQLRGLARRGVDVPEGQRRLVARLGLLGCVLGGLAAVVYSQTATVDVVAVATGPLALPYTVVTVVGGAMQLAGWVIMHRRGELTEGTLTIISIGLALALLASGVVRESVRLVHTDMSAYYPQHVAAAEAGGRWLFFVFLVVNALVAAFAIRLGVVASRSGADELNEAE